MATTTSPARKVIVRVKGGLGNQLFAYAAAFRLAYKNGCELVVDDRSGFARDRLYRRRCGLSHFAITARYATAAERLEPMERVRRAVEKAWARCRPFEKRRYLEEESPTFDSRLLSRRVARSVVLDGLWQSEGYFKDVESAIRGELQIIAPKDPDNLHCGAEIEAGESVGVHIRGFDRGGANSLNLGMEYYRAALGQVERVAPNARFFLFSDEAEMVQKLMAMIGRRATAVVHNHQPGCDYADMWLSGPTFTGLFGDVIMRTCGSWNAAARS